MSIENKRIKVAVIDSGINIYDDYFRKKKIESYYYIEDSFQMGIGDANGHGTNIIKILLREAPDIDIISIKILDKKNTCSILALVAAIEFSIQLEVDFINLSLGYTMTDKEKIHILKEVCWKADRKGIIIVAAENNQDFMLSYPANFENVIKVNSKDCMFHNIKVNKNSGDITFLRDYICLIEQNRTILIKGNSFLCPIVVGLCCHLKNNSNKLIRREECLQFLTQVEKVSDYIFSIKEKDLFMIKNKTFYFYTNKIEEEENLIRFLESKNKVKLIYNKCNKNGQIFFNEIISQYENSNSILILGELTYSFFEKNQQEIYNWVQQTLNKKIPVYMTTPLFYTYQRFELFNQYKVENKSIYK